MASNKGIDVMKDVDLTTVDPDTLVDLGDVHIDDKLKTEERIVSFINQIKNPYCFKVGKIIVKQSFSEDGVSLEDRLIEIASRMQT